MFSNFYLLLQVSPLTGIRSLLDFWVVYTVVGFLDIRHRCWIFGQHHDDDRRQGRTRSDSLVV